MNQENRVDGPVSELPIPLEESLQEIAEEFRKKLQDILDNNIEPPSDS